MTYVYKQINADGTVIEHNKPMTLEEMQHAVAAANEKFPSIEIVQSQKVGESLVINEEGLLLELPVNRSATALMHPKYGRQQLVGTVLVVKRSTL